MDSFTIRDIENLSGIKAHAWRIWEQRYNIGVAQRKDSNHRVFDNENLKKVLRIAYLYHHGLKISKIASLDNETIKEWALKKYPEENSYAYYIKELIEASIDLDEDRFEHTFNEADQRLGTEQTFLNVIHPFQEKIGMLWLTDHIIPAQEHFTSNIIAKKLIIAIDQLPKRQTDLSRNIVLFTPENERHELPLLLIHYLLKKYGSNVIYLGASVPISVLKQYMSLWHCSHIMFHFITNLITATSSEYLQELSENFPDQTIVMSGRQGQMLSTLPKKVRLLKSMADIVDFASA